MFTFRIALQVRSLLSLFVDIEHTDRSNTFYEKFRTRSLIGEILGGLTCINIIFYRFNSQYAMVLCADLNNPRCGPVQWAYRNGHVSECFYLPSSTCPQQPSYCGILLRGWQRVMLSISLGDADHWLTRYHRLPGLEG